jgi:hypothetical protein
LEIRWSDGIPLFRPPKTSRDIGSQFLDPLDDVVDVRSHLYTKLTPGRARLLRGTHPMKSRKLSSGPVVAGQCLCGAVQFEMEYPAFWAWHDHSRASRLAHGAVYATYVGTWRKRFRITAGEREINRFEEKETGAVRSFCRRCGTPLIYERTRSRHMINIPRALFQSRTGRQPIYHIAIEEMQDWAYAGEPLVPLKGYPGVFCKRSKKKSRV